ncbi:hypothetical protein [Neoroseomonas lacus]|uniref:hypothetical protein n=1 Tax=Neoroseomonas lacus TaxID=287609 RepID=UPI0016629D0A|nr:hypothetical protein [Neoroseomonas lacus]
MLTSSPTAGCRTVALPASLLFAGAPHVDLNDLRGPRLAAGVDAILRVGDPAPALVPLGRPVPHISNGMFSARS